MRLQWVSTKPAKGFGKPSYLATQRGKTRLADLSA